MREASTISSVTAKRSVVANHTKNFPNMQILVYESQGSKRIIQAINFVGSYSGADILLFKNSRGIDIPAGTWISVRNAWINGSTTNNMVFTINGVVAGE